MDKEINIDTDKLKEKYLSFRKISIGFYLFSFTVVTILFVMYLYSSKNNRMCQYGSTLYCDTTLTYPLTTNSNKKYIEIVFQTPTTFPSSETINYVYNSPGDTYNVDYYFGTTIPSGVTNRVEEIELGISLNGSVGASLYFENTDYANANNLQGATLSVLNSSNLFTIFQNPNNITIEYTYPNVGTTYNAPTSTVLFASSKKYTYTSTAPKNVNWMTLLEKLNTQKEKGCKIGVSTIGCACIELGYVTTKLCSDLVFNSSNGLHCEPDNPKCTTPCSGSKAKYTNCGWRFCAPVSYNTELTGLKTITNGHYQTAFTPGLKIPETKYYKLGQNGPLLSTKLAGSTGYKDFKTYPTYQNFNYCGGQSKGNNNIDNKPITETTATFPPSFNNYTPLDATHPILNSKNNFDF